MEFHAVAFLPLLLVCAGLGWGFLTAGRRVRQLTEFRDDLAQRLADLHSSLEDASYEKGRAQHLNDVYRRTISELESKELQFETDKFVELIRLLEFGAQNDQTGFRYLGLYSPSKVYCGNTIAVTNRTHMPISVVAVGIEPDQRDAWDVREIRLGNRSKLVSASPLPGGAIVGFLLEQPAVLFPGVDIMVEATLRDDQPPRQFRAVVVGRPVENAVYRGGEWVSADGTPLA